MRDKLKNRFCEVKSFFLNQLTAEFHHMKQVFISEHITDRIYISSMKATTSYNASNILYEVPLITKELHSVNQISVNEYGVRRYTVTAHEPSSFGKTVILVLLCITILNRMLTCVIDIFSDRLNIK